MVLLTDIDLFSYPRWNDSCIWRPQDELLLVFRISETVTENAEVWHDITRIVLNTEGKDTWLLCTGEHTVNEIVDTLQKEYEGDYRTIQKDVLEMLATLVEKGYIIMEKSPCPATRDLDEDGYPVRSDDVITNTVEGNFVIMHMKTSEVHSFDQDMEQVWNLCDGTHTVGEILSAANTDDVAFMIHFLMRLGVLVLKP